jgi:NAD(P)-dependent dehydrogenase (short-subunit alcohol dehydrogenase family)
VTKIVTGANRGLGYATARALAADRSRAIVLAGRDLPDLTRAARRIQASTGNSNLLPMHLDLADLASVRAFANEFRAGSLPPLTTIICNAGISKPTVRERSADGYEVVFAVNHLGHFLLVNLLLDCLLPPARILFVSSGAHDPAEAQGPMQPPRYIKAAWLAHPELDPDLPADDAFAGGQAYATSKLCNLLCTYELARRLEGSGLSTPERPITVHGFAPGLMAGTGLGRDEKAWTRFTWHFVLPVMSRLLGFGRTPAQAGADLAYLATAPELAGVTGKYFRGREMVVSSAVSYDQSKATDLWQTSIELSQLQPAESPLVQANHPPPWHPEGGDPRPMRRI